MRRPQMIRTTAFSGQKMHRMSGLEILEHGKSMQALVVKYCLPALGACGGDTKQSGEEWFCTTGVPAEMARAKSQLIKNWVAHDHGKDKATENRKARARTAARKLLKEKAAANSEAPDLDLTGGNAGRGEADAAHVMMPNNGRHC